MPIPSGNGSEVLKNVNGTVANATTSVITAVDTNHIITVLSIVLFNTHGSSTMPCGITLNNGSADLKITYTELKTQDTFVWNDRIVLHPTHILKIYEQGNLTLNYWVSYIEQDWS